MTPLVAAAFLIAFTFCRSRSISPRLRRPISDVFLGWGPTELRILLAIGALTLLVKPVVTIFGSQMLLFDVGGIVGGIGLIVTAIVSAVGNTRRLYAAEPLPQTLVSQRRDAKTQRAKPHTETTQKAAVFSAGCVSELCG